MKRDELIKNLRQIYNQNQIPRKPNLLLEPNAKRRISQGIKYGKKRGKKKALKESIEAIIYDDYYIIWSSFLDEDLIPARIVKYESDDLVAKKKVPKIR